MAKETIPIKKKPKTPIAAKKNSAKKSISKKPIETTKKESEQESIVSAADTRIEKYYYKIVAAFVILSVILAILIVYFAFSKTDITVYAKSNSEEITLIASLQDVDGVLMLSDIGGTFEYTDIEGTDKEEDFATGTVTLTNETSQDQTLVSTTRLLSQADNEADRVLFRTQEYVVVPAGGSVDVAVAADEKGARGDIGPSDFEIVALDESVKASIYGKSSAPMSGGLIEKTIVSEEDIEKAEEEGRKHLEKQAMELFRSEAEKRTDMPEHARLIESPFVVEAPVETTDAVPGNPVQKITVDQQLTIATPVINEEALMAFINAELSNSLTENTVVTSNINPDDIVITLRSVSDNQTTAELEVQLRVETTLSEGSDILDINKLLNKTKDEIYQQLTSFEEIEDVDIDFSPFWARRTGGSESSIEITVETKKQE